MKRDRVLAFLLCVLFFLMAGFALPQKEVELIRGKNNLSVNWSGPMVEELVEEYPQIEAISSREENKGYVNVFGGIGENFRIEENKKYEVAVSENITIII